MTPERQDVVIAGAGLAGCLLAVLLARRGLSVSVYERRSDPRGAGFKGGRSINLALSTRGIRALERADVAEAVLADAVRMPGRMMHAPDGRLTFQPYSKNADDAINSVSRGGLNLTLLERAERAGVEFHFGCRCRGVDLDGPVARFQRDDEKIFAGARLVVGADGAYSAIRGRLQRTDRFNYSQSFLEHGYKELTIPPRDDGAFAMEPNALHIWPRGGSMMIALPNPDHSFTCTLFWPFTGPLGFDKLTSPDEIRVFFDRHYGDAVPLMPTLIEDYVANPVSSLVTVRCRPWHHPAGVTLIGDAAHAIVPFYGQGMNAAFEDCHVFDQLVETHDGDWAQILPAFTEARHANADAIADMAVQNFFEMRDKVGSRWFLLKKRAEQMLHRLFPRTYLPLYNMVTFSTIPYAEAQRRARGRARLGRNVLWGTGVLLIFVALALLWRIR